MDIEKPLYALADIRIRGLLHLLRDDVRLHVFVERELGALLSYDQRDQADLVRVLQTSLKHGGNKSTAAHELGMSRRTLYERLKRIAVIVGCNLSSVESCLSLHVALIALGSQRDRQHREHETRVLSLAT